MRVGGLLVCQEAEDWWRPGGRTDQASADANGGEREDDDKSQRKYKTT